MNGLCWHWRVVGVLLLAASWGPSSPALARDPAPRFTGILSLRQQNGDLYYKVFVVRGRVIGGWQRWRDVDEPHHDIVGGWYRGQRLAIFVQSAQDDVDDKWFSHFHQFEKAPGGLFILRHSLYGFGSTAESGGVYQPHVHEEASEMTEDAVRQRLKEATEKRVKPAENAEPRPAVQPAPESDSKDAK